MSFVVRRLQGRRYAVFEGAVQRGARNGRACRHLHRAARTRAVDRGEAGGGVRADLASAGVRGNMSEEGVTYASGDFIITRSSAGHQSRTFAKPYRVFRSTESARPAVPTRSQ